MTVDFRVERLAFRSGAGCRLSHEDRKGFEKGSAGLIGARKLRGALSIFTTARAFAAS